MSEWMKITHDPWVLHVIEGMTLTFSQIPIQSKEPFPYRLSRLESKAAVVEINKLLDKNVLEIAQDSYDQIISNIFFRPKKDGNFRMILDLTWVNKHIEYQHFKMCSLNTAKHMLRSDCFMGSVDLQDAYYSVLIHSDFRKYLRFRWNGILYQYRAMPNGLSCAPLYFTKILNPVFAYLRSMGHETFQYIDDSFVVSDSYDKCSHSLLVLCETVEKLGFVVHKDKSKLYPSKQLTFLGFDLNSETMCITLTEDKVEKFKRASTDILNKKYSTIREVAGLVGLMTSYSQAFNYAEAHMKDLEIEKIQALKLVKGNFDGKMSISHKAKLNIFWWLQNIGVSQKNISYSQVDFEIYTDASEHGWGAHVGDCSTGGRWSKQESLLHINALEMLAIWFALKSFCKQTCLHVKIFTDNTTAVAYVRHMGGVKSGECNRIANMIWSWCESHSIWLTIAHIPGVQNVLADFKSRKFADNVEWSLNPSIFERVCNTFGKPQVDLFASRLNCKCVRYVSWTPDPEAIAIDAFTLNWSSFSFYAFPPFSVIPQVISKILRDRATGVLIVPWWPSQTWWARLINLKLRKLQFRPAQNNLVPVGHPSNVEFINRCPLGAFLFSLNLY